MKGIRLKVRKLIEGVGINDADYVTQEIEYYFKDGKRRTRKAWCCPFYQKWVSMLKRCYSKKRLSWTPTYADCIVCEDWVYFSNFKAWMEKQSWEGKVLDKDILVPGNKVYGPETCVFVTQRVNMFVVKQSAERDLPTGVLRTNYDPNKFTSKAKLMDGKYIHFGVFDTAEAAHTAWKKHKLEVLYSMRDEINDERVFEALRKTFE